jgi:dTDP-4-amino-4,6-dideoxygalactose transaminase
MKAGHQGTLAIHGGTPVRTKKMPWRQAFGKDEIAQLTTAIEYYHAREEDPPYAGHFKQQYCAAFAQFMGGGFAHAVSSGTAGIYVGLAALDLAKGSEVIISPVTDSGSLAPIILQGFVPVVADSAPDSYNIGLDQFLQRVTTNTLGLIAVHAGGEPIRNLDAIVAAAHARGIRVLEDCSQATGAVWKGQRVGTFGDVAAFSTMYRKNLAAGGSSGLVLTKDLAIYRRVLGHSDRGKPLWRDDLDFRDPGYADFPALNFNTDELACAIGLASLRRLQDTIDRRVRFVSRLVSLLEKARVCRPYAFHSGFSPFYFPIFVDPEKVTCTKNEFAKAVAAEGIGLGAHYGCLVCTWQWARPYLSDDFATSNALSTRDRVFHLYLNERYGDEEAEDIVAAILKVENYFSK